MNVVQYIPLDREASHTGLLGKDVAADLLDDGLGRRVGIELLRLIFVVDVVSHAHELPTVVGASQEDDRDAHNLGIGNALGIRGIRLENELVDTDGNRSHQQGVQLLVILIAWEPWCQYGGAFFECRSCQRYAWLTR